eukprot:gnl/TRDRNA2_/TRDRNA2_139678_c0_seq1.p1 gnl/TRDRNA2_/TRDRNA2_139678_c0~~gnl/TRDRNA2_/TRDRNA2_139678_c0_seq1.p1  ORF type:complete len:151 (-),score=27.14 gnl/TRDRNA2_/TRDRNA2_139678_c0_seq1:20-472(-)
MGLARAAVRCMNDFKPQNLAKVAWAGATSGHWDMPVLEALAGMAEQRAISLNAQDLAIMASAFSNDKHACSVPLLIALGREVRLRIDEFDTQGLVNTAQAFARAAGRAGGWNAPLFVVLTRATVQRIDASEFYAQDVHMTLWALSRYSAS